MAAITPTHKGILEIVKLTMMWNGNAPVHVAHDRYVAQLLARGLLLREGAGYVLTRKGARLV